MNKSGGLMASESYYNSKAVKVMEGQFGSERKNKAFHLMIKNHGLYNGGIGKDGSISHNQYERIYSNIGGNEHE
jgi:hypothetical protein